MRQLTTSITAEQQQLLPLLLHLVLAGVMALVNPIVLVQYKREHFVSRDASLRLTLDYGIKFIDQVGKRLISTRYGKKLSGLVVLEGKTPVGREHELRSLLAPLSPRTGRCSKYVHGCQTLGHVARD